MKFYGTDSGTAKAASREGTFLIQTEVLSSSGMISTPHEAKSTFSVSPKHGLCLSAISRAKQPSLVFLGPQVPGMVWYWRNLLWSVEGCKDRAVLALCRHIVPVLWVLWEHPCTQPQQWAPAAAPHTILIRVSGVLRGCMLAAKLLCVCESSNGLWHRGRFLYSKTGISFQEMQKLGGCP